MIFTNHPPSFPQAFAQLYNEDILDYDKVLSMLQLWNIASTIMDSDLSWGLGARIAQVRIEPPPPPHNTSFHPPTHPNSTSFQLPSSPLPNPTQPTYVQLNPLTIEQLNHPPTHPPTKAMGISGFHLEDHDSLLLDVPDHARKLRAQQEAMYAVLGTFHPHFHPPIHPFTDPYNHSIINPPTHPPTHSPTHPPTDAKRLRETEIFRMADDGVRGVSPSHPPTHPSKTSSTSLEPSPPPPTHTRHTAPHVNRLLLLHPPTHPPTQVYMDIKEKDRTARATNNIYVRFHPPTHPFPTHSTSFEPPLSPLYK